jgi:L-asparaginase II
MSEILVKATRGGHVESLHRGSIVAVDRGGKLLGGLGDPDCFVFMRSCAKPLQVLPLLESGAADRFGFTPAEIACMCGSLNGQDYQVSAVSAILAKIGLSEDSLQCGLHPPSHRPTARLLEEEGKKPRVTHNNCAGKHAAMLALCVFFGWPPETYHQPQHPVQRLILEKISEMTEVPMADIRIGIDGCGVPVFAVPLRNLAWAYAKLAIFPDAVPKNPPPAEAAIYRLMKAALDHPEMIAGDQRICTDIMRALPGKIFAKTGAEGSYGLGFMGEAVGIAVKIEDGSNRGLHPAVIEVLRQLNCLDEKARTALKPYGPVTPIRNHRKDLVGEVAAVFNLNLL